MGPYDDISLKHEWALGTEFTVSIAWIDPVEIIAASYDVNIPASYYIGNQRPILNKPLRPGIWTVKLMIDFKLVAESSFLISPLTFFNNRPISISDALRSHQGPIGSYTSTNFSELSTNLNVNHSPSLQQEADKNSKKFGAELEQWIDTLAKWFWVVRDSCVLEPVGICPHLSVCQEMFWSSKSPDPKSDPQYIGEGLPNTFR